MKNKIYQIQIALNGSKPKIWRRVLIPSNLLVSDFHKIIQSTMGWANSHLHQFIKEGRYYSKRSPHDDFWEEGFNTDYSKLHLSNLLSNINEKITYEYDFGDGWEHILLLEKILPIDKNVKYPICLKGKMNCPPEDCGGIWGYANLVDILSQPDHKEYDDSLEWVGEEFDPKYFDVEDVNLKIQSENFGCFEMW